MLEIITNITYQLNTILWGPVMIVFLFGTHLYMSFKTGFIQKYTFKGIKLSLSKDEDSEGDISPFAALTTALASTIGTGNIIGVSTAIVSGGPGAVFWTWITGILGISTKYAESYIAIKHRKKLSDGSYIGGAMTALEKINLKPLGIVFALITLCASFGIGCGVQSNAIADLLKTNYQIPVVITSVIVAILTAIVIFGGVKSISKTCETLVPVMSILYTLGCLVILIINHDVLFETIQLIVVSAFSPRAAMGGFIGSSIMTAARYGIARGLFSNEAGLGSAPIVASASKTNNAAKIALINATGVFWDTVVVCLMTGLVLCTSIVKNPEIMAVGINGGELASLCFAQIKYIGTPLLVFGVLTFAYSTILGWNYYGERCLKYLNEKASAKLYYVVWVVVAFIGGIVNLDLIWKIADNLNALMVVPNLIAVILMRKLIVKDLNYYVYQDHLDEKDVEME